MDARGTWQAVNAEELDPRVRAALQGADPAEPQPVELTEAARDVMSAAVAELGQSPPARLPGIAPVLGAGVLAKVLRDRRGEAANPADAAGSRIDARR